MSDDVIEGGQCPLLARSGHTDLHRKCPLLGVKRTFIQGRLSVPSFSGGFAWRKRRLVAGTSMNNSIFHAKTLQTEVFRSARRLVEIEKYFVHRIPTGDDLVDLLIADCLPQNRKSPEQFGTGAFQKIMQLLTVLCY
ncbi:MAG: hypothetical protein WA694_13400 [Pseudolabrys sp.]